MQGMWASVAVCGLVAANVGSSAHNEGQRPRLVAANVGPFFTCLWVHALMIVGRYTYGSE